MMADKSPKGVAPETVDKIEFEPIKGYPMLYWKGKRPFTSTQYYPAQLKETYGVDVNGWRNRIYWGDNLQVMSHLLKEFRGKVNLIYIDPPFDSKADYKKKIRLRGQTITNDQNAFEEKQYTDIWTNDEYLQFMYERMILLRELLASDGTLFIHCDASKGHHLRCLADEIFGETHFKNEIIWYYENKLGTGGEAIDSRHDSLLVYTKGKVWTYNEILEPVKKVKLQPVTQKIDNERVWLRDEEGNRLYQEGGGERPIGDVWTIPIINPVANERTGYPTQKPERLLERIILSSSNPNDLIFDCFMGSGTTQVVAMEHGRRFIGADINLGAMQIASERLLGKAETLRSLQKKLISDESPKYTGFELYNVNHYDLFRNPVQAKELIIEALEIQPLPSSIVYDGEKDGRLVRIMPVNRLATRADLNELIANFDYKALEKKHNENPNKPVEKLLLVCMGHEPDLAAHLQKEMLPFKLDIEVVDILRDRSKLEFKRDSEAKISSTETELVIEKFYPMNLLQKLSLFKENVEDWRELVESVMIDFNYDGAIFQPTLLDIPEKNELVAGKYEIPDDAGNIRVKITDLLSESLEVDA